MSRFNNNVNDDDDDDTNKMKLMEIMPNAQIDTTQTKYNPLSVEGRL